MSTIDYLSEVERKKVLDEIINSEENLRRKEESLMSYEIFKGRQAPFILQKIQQDLGVDAALSSRAITSINLSKKIVKEQASIYKNQPTRLFSNLNEAQTLHAEMLYSMAAANVKFKKTNEIYKLQDQAATQVVLKDGKLMLRPLYGHHYDVIPKATNPEKADAYVVSSFDKKRLFSFLGLGKAQYPINIGRDYQSDRFNQIIADPDDYKSKSFYYWWTDEFNFVTNGHGQYVDDNGNVVSLTEDQVKNPIGKLPFVDVAADKDFEFFVRSGYSSTQFNLELGLMLSDTSDINKLQGFSQAVISSVEEPQNLKVGQRRVLWLKLKPNDTETSRPSFGFESPSPDLNASLTLISNFLSMYLTSEGLSPKLINTAGEKEMYTSGVDRFLASVEKFEISQDDISLFTQVENNVWDLFKAWNNVYYNATDNGFIDKLSGVFLPEDSELHVKYEKPQLLMSDADKLTVIEKKLELGLMSRIEAIAKDREIDKDMAKEVIAEIEAELVPSETE